MPINKQNRRANYRELSELKLPKDRTRTLEILGFFLHHEGVEFLMKNIDGVSGRDHGMSITSEFFIKLSAHPNMLFQVINARNPLHYLIASLRRFAIKVITKERNLAKRMITGERADDPLRTCSCSTDIYKEMIRKDPDFLRKIRTILNPREYQVFKYRAYGSNLKQIANCIGLKLDTVKGYSKFMRKKLKAKGLDFFGLY